LAPLASLSLAGQEHDQTIPLADVGTALPKLISQRLVRALPPARSVRYPRQPGQRLKLERAFSCDSVGKIGFEPVYELASFVGT
jgi:hypothetical protein